MTAFERQSFVEGLGFAEPQAIVQPVSPYFGWRRHVKRSMDIAIVVVASPALLVAGALLAVAVKLSSPGPVRFRQERIGRGGTVFRMVKFRTMYVDSDERLDGDPELYARFLDNDFKLARDEDPRIAPGGKLLRAASLDELPQFWHVLTGRMSVVGPRPIVPAELARYGSLDYAYLSVRPGNTGRWQTAGPQPRPLPGAGRSRRRLPRQLEPVARHGHHAEDDPCCTQASRLRLTTGCRPPPRSCPPRSGQSGRSERTAIGEAHSGAELGEWYIARPSR